MINLRMIGLAAAILLFIPVGMAAWPDDDPNDGAAVTEYVVDAAFEVTDVAIANLPREKAYDPDSFQETERLVEGHTVFVTIDLEYDYVEANGTIDIWGDVHCSYDASAPGRSYTIPLGPYSVPIVVPERVDHARAQCTVMGQTVVMPDPTQGMPMSQPTPTGRQFPYETPNGARASAVEYEYLAERPDGAVTTLYAWLVPLHEPWLDFEGRPKNFYCPIPEDRLVEMGLEDFKVYHQQDAPLFR